MCLNMNRDVSNVSVPWKIWNPFTDLMLDIYTAPQTYRLITGWKYLVPATIVDG